MNSYLILSKMVSTFTALVLLSYFYYSFSRLNFKLCEDIFPKHFVRRCPLSLHVTKYDTIQQSMQTFEYINSCCLIFCLQDVHRDSQGVCPDLPEWHTSAL